MGRPASVFRVSRLTIHEYKAPLWGGRGFGYQTHPFNSLPLSRKGSDGFFALHLKKLFIFETNEVINGTFTATPSPRLQSL